MADSTTIGKLIIQMLLDTQPFGEGTRQIAADTRKMGADLKTWANGLNTVVVGAMKAAGVALAGFAAGSAVMGAAFQQKMQYVGVVAGATGDQLDALTAKARELGSTTTYSASQAADAMALLAGSGLNVAQTLQATGDALRMAGVDGASLETAAAAVTATMAQFSLQASESSRIADMFAKATALSQFKIESLSDAMKYGGTVGAGFGWSLEQTVAALTLFRDAGLDGTRAGTALRGAMAQATMENNKTIASLDKYHLKMEDINPETNTFAQILETVGKAGMTTTDAMVIFGVESGAVMKTLASQAADGSTKYQDMLKALEGSTGAAAAMYEQMNATVSGSFARLRSSAQEVLLTLFDMYQGPLASLLGSVANVVRETVAALKGVSGEVGGSMETAIGAVTDFLDTNAAYIGSSLAGFVQSVSAFADEIKSLLPILQALLPLLDDIALTMGLVWVASKVAQYASAVENAIRVMAGMQWALRSMMAELTAATGGVYALIAALGVLVVGLIALINRYTEAEAKAKALKAAQDALAGSTATENQARAAYLETLLATQRAQAAAALEAEAASGNLTQARRNELELLSQLTGATAQQLEAEGKLVLVRGQLRSAASIAQDMDPDDVAAFNARVGELTRKAAAAEGQIGLLKDQLASYTEAQKEAASGDIAKSYEASIVDVKVQIQALESEVPKMKAAVAKLTGDYTKAGTDMLVSEAKNQGKVGDMRAKAAADGVEKEKEYVDKVKDLHEGLASELARIGVSELMQVDLDTADRINKATQAYNEQLALAKGNAAEQKRLWEQFQTDLAAITEIGEKKKLELIMDAANKGADARQAEAEKNKDTIWNLENEGAAESVRLEHEKVKALADIGEGFLADRLQITALYDEKITEARKAELEEETRLAKEATDKQRTFLDELVDGWGYVKGAAGAVVGAVTGVTSAIQGAWDVSVGFVSSMASGLETLTGFAFNLTDAMDSVQQAVDDATQAAEDAKLAADEAGTTAEPSTQVIPTIAEAAATYMQGMVDSAVAGIALMTEALPTLLTGLVAAIPTVIDAFIAALPSLVDAVLAAIPSLVQVFATYLPVLITTLLALLPQVLPVLLDAAFQVVSALIAQLPRLLVGIIGMLPGLLTAILAMLPSIIQGLISGLTQVIVAILLALPDIVQAIVDALPSILIALIDGIIAAIPPIIMALVSSIPQIIVTIVQAIPTIIQAVVSQIPLFITTMVGLIPTLITGIAQALPDLIPALITIFTGPLFLEILAKLVEALPEIIGALFTAFFVELPKQLPDLAVALGKAIVDGVVNSVKALGQAIADVFVAVWNAVFGWIYTIDTGKDEGSHYAGINYVPATMRVTVHPGEMVVPASRNPARATGRSDPALAGAPGGGSAGGTGAPIEIGIYTDGRLVEKTLLSAQKTGKATGLTRLIRTTAGVHAGLDRGRTVRWK